MALPAKKAVKPFDPTALLNKPTTATPKESKSKVPVVEPSPAIQKALVRLRAIDNQRDSLDAEAELIKSQANQEVIPAWERICQETGFITSVKLRDAENILSTVTFPRRYKKLVAEYDNEGCTTERAIRDVVGDEAYDRWFELFREIKVKAEADYNEVLGVYAAGFKWQRLVEYVTAGTFKDKALQRQILDTMDKAETDVDASGIIGERFSKDFEVTALIKPNQVFEEEHLRKLLPEEREALKMAGVERIAPGYRLK